jgi:predicted O-methyltransferase YrrM
MLERLRPPFSDRLASMYAGEPQVGNNGPVVLDHMTRISEPQGLWMFDTVLGLRPSRSLEVGLAYGFSTVYILAAMAQAGGGHHTALDPFQMTHWHGIGARQAQEVGMEQSFQLLQEYSFAALADFRSRQQMFEFIYIDGGHRFDEVLLDFTLAAQICPSGGHIILDDMWMPSVRTTVSWIRCNRRDFREVATPVANIAHFERVGDDDRAWDHYVRFETARARASLPTRIARRVKRMFAS